MPPGARVQPYVASGVSTSPDRTIRRSLLTSVSLPLAQLRSLTEGLTLIPDQVLVDDPARRRVHGVAAQSFFTSLLLMAANVRKIRTFLKQNVTPLVPAARIRVRRRRSASLEHWRPKGQGVAPPSTSDPPSSA